MKNNKPKKKKKKELQTHPTLFVLEGSLRYFPKGSMLELYSQITVPEWEQIVEDTIKYRIFINCLKEIFPLLHEKWSVDDEYYRLQLDVAISRIRNIDALLLLKYNEAEIKESYLVHMKARSMEIVEQIKTMRQAHEDIKQAIYKESKTITVSNL